MLHFSYILLDAVISEHFDCSISRLHDLTLYARKSLE
jgi:hypothetical protein